MNLDNHQMAINIKNRLSNETHNYECIVSDHTIVSPHKFHEIQAGDKFVACYEVRKTVEQFSLLLFHSHFIGNTIK